MEFKKSWTGNWENAFHGLRHPMESYAKSDSAFGIAESDEWLKEVANEVIYSYNEDPEDIFEEREKIYDKGILQWGKYTAEYAFIGKNDMDLAQRMIKAGSPNDKFLRQIFVSVDITAPVYWWRDMDQYKVGTVTNSTSTMHKLASTPITLDRFEMDDINDSLKVDSDEDWYEIKDFYTDIIQSLESLRLKYLETKDKRYWKELVRWLPNGWLQTRTWSADYAVLRNIIRWRSDHKLSEWRQFVDWSRTLPYAEELLFYNNSIN